MRTTTYSLLPLALLLLALQPFSPSALSAAAPAPDPAAAAIAAGVAQMGPQPKAATRPKSEKWRLNLLPTGLQKNPQIDYVIVTDLTDAGRKLPAPTFNKPVYYLSHSMNQKDAGDADGGTKDIQFKALQKALNTALVSNGYRPYDPANPKNAPTQVFFFTWGRHNRKNMATPDSDPENTTGYNVLAGGVILGGDADPNDDFTPETDPNADPSADPAADADTGYDPDAGSPVSLATDELKNLLDRAKIVGGQKFAAGFTAAVMRQLDLTPGTLDYNQPGPLADFVDRADNNRSLIYTTFNDCYWLMVYSYDLESIKPGHQKKLLWVTRIATTSRGISFEQTLPIMINNGAYFFGRETDGPEIVRKRAYQSANVEIGEAQVVEYVSGTTATTGTTKPATPKPTATGTTTPAPKK